ncbi:hypothetical protein ABH922_003725 [Rhodococcus sp. 27YEA15]|uniref:hypothetical protein n=1 Tax=Rhodococcus sp. 27YEA15 TaxID=3156259 RepID=UPI003C7DEFDF
MRRIGLGSTRSLAVALVVALGLVSAGAGIAAAQDSAEPTTSAPESVDVDQESEIVPAGSVPISFTELGRGIDVLFPSNDTAVVVTVPVPDGLTASAITGTLTAPTDFSRGWLEVTAAGRLVNRLDFDGVQAGQGLPVSIPLAGLEVVDRSVTVSMVAHLVPIDDRCYDRTNYQPLAVRGASVVYDGVEEQPKTVAAFFPSILRKATVYVTDGSSEAQQSAALRLSTAIVNQYDGRPDSVVLEQLPAGRTLPQVDPQLFERSIVLSDSSEAGIDLVTQVGHAPVLRISGDARSLVSQVTLLAANFDGFWSASKALASPDRAVAEISQDVITLGQLKLGTLSASGLTHIQVDVPFSQSQLGRSLENVKLRLIGTYVPLPNSRSGELTVSVGDTRLGSQNADSSGRFDISVTIANELLRRDNVVQLAMDVTGDFQCGTSSPSTLTLDPSSTISSSTAFPPVPGGFQSLPQSMLPTIDVGLSHGDFADLVRAQRLMVQMQRLSYLPLQPRVLSFDDAATSSLPALLVAADGDLPTAVVLPMDSADQGLLRFHGFAFDSAYGALQVVSGPHNEILALTSNGDAGDADDILNWLDGDRNRFAALTGDLLVGTRDVAPFDIGVNVAPLGSTPAMSVDSGIDRALLGWIGAGTVALIVIAVGAVLMARRRAK